MKQLCGTVLLVSLTSLVIAAEPELPNSKEFSIIGEIISESELDVNATAVVSQKNLNEENFVQSAELVTGIFVDDEVVLSDSIDVPTPVTISVSVADFDTISTSVVIAPGDDLIFRVLIAETGEPNQLLFVSSVRLHEDEAMKFTIMGDLSSLETEMKGTSVKIRGYGDGNVGSMDWGSVFVADDGTFKIENTIDEPRVVWIYVQNDEGFNAVSQTILESQVSISLFPDTGGSGLITRSDSDLHATLIESWANSEKYLALDDAHSSALAEYQANMAALQEAAKRQTQEESNESETESGSSFDKNDSENHQIAVKDESKEITPILALSHGIPPSGGCEHVDLDQVKPGMMDYVASTYPD